MPQKLTEETVAPLRYILWKPYGDGCEGVGMLHMYGTQYRLQLFDLNAPFENYCFHSYAAAVAAFTLWNPETMTECPQGWVKHIETNRCRLDGDPKKESIGWPIPPLVTREERAEIHKTFEA